ncbi:MAG: class I SAM-dependent methyltransferase, partial [Chitinispirillaceae bacterium]|nr:class I SAM-dependent methyltransferase [Chitinispirillaceae bacterium]
MSYYESYGTRKVSPLGQWLNRYFARTISAVVNSFCAPNSTVVEIGSGNGLIAGELSQTHRYTCYEPSKILADHLRFIGLTVKEQFVPPLTETQESLDAVLAVHVVEHQVDYLHAAELFNSVHRVLKPGGI